MATRNKTAKAPVIPAYINCFWKAMKPLVRHAPHGWTGKFIARLAEAARHMGERGPVGLTDDAAMGHDAGKIELLALFLDANEREVVLELIEAVLSGDPLARHTLQIVHAAHDWRLRGRPAPVADDVKGLAARICERSGR